ncbi:MAG TPA: hypothetical protein VF593_06270 [Chthoniobacteraceae bacterium]|jgi:hypothetical protein
MRFLPKRHFKWTEPRAFLKLNDAFECSKRRWWHQPLWVFVVAALAMLHWFFVRLDPDKPPLPFALALLAGLAFGAFLVYFIPWFVSLCPSEVHFYDRHLIRVRGDTHQQLKYSEVRSFCWRVRDDFATLILTHGKRQREFLIGVPPEVSQAAVTHSF